MILMLSTIVHLEFFVLTHTYMFQIQAKDEDLGINGQEGLKFSIIQVPGTGVPSFRINEDTGEIFANRVSFRRLMNSQDERR